MFLSRRLMALVLTGFLGFSSFASSFVSSINEPLDCEHHQCLGIVDAGSTGSRVHLYTYDLDEQKTPINIVEHWSKKIKPGLASLSPEQATINAYLTELFSDGPNVHSFPIYFYATAGMRLFPQSKQAGLYAYLSGWFDKQNQWKLLAAKTISGHDEGLYAWLAVNYQLGTLNNSSAALAGVMDMGGASVQIAFPTLDADQLTAQDIQVVDLYGRHFTVFVHSFLGLGQTEMTHQFLNHKNCFSSQYPLPDAGFAEGDALSCERDVAVLINSIHHVKGTVEPTLRMNNVPEWYVLGGASDMVKSKPFSLSSDAFNGQAILTQGNVLCHRDWNSLHGDFPSDDYLYGDCLFSAYYYALFVDGYGFSADQTLHTLPPEYNADWTIGAVLMNKGS